MGNLASISLGDESDRIILFGALLDAGATVRDVVRLGLTCTTMRAWACVMVARLSLASLDQLVASLPSRTFDEWQRHFNDSSLPRFAWGSVGWERDDYYTEPRVIEFTLSPSSVENLRSVHLGYCHVLHSTNRVFHGMYQYHNVQWYPMLDKPIKTAVARLKLKAFDAAMAEEDRVLKIMRLQ